MDGKGGGRCSYSSSPPHSFSSAFLYSPEVSSWKDGQRWMMVHGRVALWSQDGAVGMAQGEGLPELSPRAGALVPGLPHAQHWEGGSTGRAGLPSPHLYHVVERFVILGPEHLPDVQHVNLAA